MIDHLSQIFIAGEIDVLDTSVWYTQLARKDFTVAMNVSGIGIDDTDVVFYEGYACGSQRNYTNYCNRELQAKLDEQSATHDHEERKKLVWEINHRLQEDGARPVIYQRRPANR